MAAAAVMKGVCLCTAMAASPRMAARMKRLRGWKQGKASLMNIVTWQHQTKRKRGRW